MWVGAGVGARVGVAVGVADVDGVAEPLDVGLALGFLVFIGDGDGDGDGEGAMFEYFLSHVL